MDNLIFIVSCLGVLGTAMVVSFILGRGSVMHDPYNFVQSTKLEPNEIQHYSQEPTSKRRVV